MHIEKIVPNVFRLSQIFNDEKQEIIYNFISNLDYSRKQGIGFKYWILIFSDRLNKKQRNIFFGLMKNEFLIILNLLNRLYGKNYVLNTMGSFIKLEKGDYIEEHFDTHSDIQCVMHFQNIKSDEKKGGGLVIYHIDKSIKTEHIIFPQEKSIIFFLGKTLHAVPEYNGDEYRYSISFGFSESKNISRNGEHFFKQVEKYIDNA